MEQTLSSKPAFFSALAIIFGVGVPLMVTGFIVWGIACAIAGFILLALFLLLQTQHIDITNIRCEVLRNVIMGDSHPMGVMGSINARHTIELIDCRLMVSNDAREYPEQEIGLPEKIDSVYRYFLFRIPIPKDDKTQQVAWGLIFIKIVGKILYTQPFQIPTTLPDDKGWYKTMAKKLRTGIRQSKDEGEITKKKLHELLDKASQPVKKSEKGKS